MLLLPLTNKRMFESPVTERPHQAAFRACFLQVPFDLWREVSIGPTIDLGRGRPEPRCVCFPLAQVEAGLQFESRPGQSIHAINPCNQLN